MIKNILYQQREERNYLSNIPYIDRIDADSQRNYLLSGLIKLITGPRRAGKSVLAFQILKNEHFAYLNFDDDLLLKYFDENEVPQTLNEIYGSYKYLFLDEIQNLPNWELWVNKLYRRGVNLIITGSNANLLSREMASSLTGRFIQIPVFPFGFAEFLKFKNAALLHETAPGLQKKGIILNLLNTYMEQGGFPEILLNPAILKNYLSSLFDSVLLKDIMKRFKIRNTQQMYDLSNYLLTNYTNLYSFNQLKTDLNFSSVPTAQKFVSYLSEPYLFISLTRFSVKLKTQQKAPKKSFVIDNGFIKARSFELSPNYGRLLENAVFIELLRRNYKPELDLFYYRTRNDKEIDFVCRKGHKIEQLIQVCYDVTLAKTLKRETDALLEASSELTCNNLILITWDKEEIIVKNTQKIKLIPAWRWFCQ